MYIICLRHGPLSRMWSMRYEAKHRYFKRWAGIMGNFKNIPKTLAAHHQRYMCYKLLQANYLTTPASTGPSTVYYNKNAHVYTVLPRIMLGFV